MKMLIVVVAVLILDGEARFVLKEGGFRSMAECQERVVTAHGPESVCAEIPAAYLARRRVDQ
jgi:hypothetical protein